MSEAKSRPDDHELHMRHMQVGLVCITNRSPMLSEACGVNEAGIWDEGARAYPRRSDRYAESDELPQGNPCSNVRLNGQKSAEAIVRSGHERSGRAEQQEVLKD